MAFDPSSFPVFPTNEFWKYFYYPNDLKSKIKTDGLKIYKLREPSSPQASSRPLPRFCLTERHPFLGTS